MGKSKAKAKVFCQCAEPRPLIGADGKPYSAEPICRKPEGCGYPVKLVPPGMRPNPGPHIQSQSPVCAWTGSGECPRQPETKTEAYRRGVRLAEDPTSAPSYVAPAPVPLSAPPSPRADRHAALARLRALRASDNSH
jgi:hypothetical protein